MMSNLQKSLLFPHPQNLSTFKRLCNFAVSERALCFHYKSYLEGGQLCGRQNYRNLISKVCRLSLSFLLIHACILSRYSHVLLFVTLWTVARQTPLSMGFSRPEYWNGLLFPPPGDFSELGIKPASLMSPALASGFFTISTTWEAFKSNQKEWQLRRSVFAEMSNQEEGQQVNYNFLKIKSQGKWTNISAKALSATVGVVF